MARRTLVLIVMAFAAVALLAACSSSGSSSSPGTTAAGDSSAGGGNAVAAPSGCRKASDGTVDLKAHNIEWDTDCLEVTGSSLKIVEDNTDKVDHPLKVKSLPGETDGKPGTETLTLTDLKPGKYEYMCTVHPNMTGTLYVEPAGSSNPAAPSSGLNP